MPNAIYNLWKVLCDFLLPRCCPGCGQELLRYEIPCCLACQTALPFTHFETFANNPVFQRMEELVPTVHATALFYLHDGGIIQQLIHQLKFNGQLHLGPWLGNLLAKQLKNSPYAHCTAIVPLPLHPQKKRKRGYNQNHKLCEQLAEALQIPLYTNAVFRTKNTAQLSLNKTQDRFAEMEAAFAINPELSIEAPHWLLVDDVLTTGATLQSCGQALLKYPKAKLSIVVLSYRM